MPSPPASPASPTTRAACRRSPSVWAGVCPATNWRVSALTTPGGTWPRCTLLASASARGRGVPKKTPSRLPPRSPANRWKSREAGGMPELPEVETIRRDLQGEVVGRKIKSVEVRNGRTVRRHPERQALPRPARGPHHQVDRPGGEVPAPGPRGRADPRGPPGHERPAAAGQERQGAQGPAHPRGHHLHPGRPAALRGPAHLRRDVRLGRPRGRGPPSPSSPTSASTRSRTS